MDGSQGTAALPARNKGDLVVRRVRGHRLTGGGGEAETFMRGLGREIHHGGESNLCPTRDSDGRVPTHKGTSLGPLRRGRSLSTRGADASG